MHPRQELPVLLAELLLVLRTNDPLDRSDLLLLTLQVGGPDLDLLALQCGEGALVVRLSWRGRGCAWPSSRADDRTEPLQQVLVDRVGLVVSKALVRQAAGPVLRCVDHPLVLNNALVELIKLSD